MGPKTSSGQKIEKIKQDIEVEDFQNICRTCMSRKDLHCIPDVVNIDGVKLIELLQQYIEVDSINNQNMPQNICNKCTIEIFKSYVFKQQCRHYDRLFEDRLIAKDVLIYKENEFNNDNMFEIVMDDDDDDDSDQPPDFYYDEEKSDEEDDDLETKEEREPNQLDKICTFEHLEEKPFICNQCNKTFTTRTLLKRHEKTHTGERPFVCMWCGKKFTQKHHVKTHMRVHVGEKLFHEYEDNFIIKDEIVKNEYEDNCIIKNEDDVKKGIKKIKGESKPHKTKCAYCDKKFDKYTMKLHLRVHTNEKPYVCEVCGDSFKMPRNLRLHRYRHTGERPYACQVCGRRFSRPTTLKKHVSNIHFKDKPEKVYTCEVCNQQFKKFVLCQMHEKEHKDEKPFKCEVCGKGFGTTALKKAHAELHETKKFLCNICGKGFARKGALTIHTRTHTNEKPFKCDLCDKAFNNRNCLRIHTRRHTGQRPYGCGQCDKKFVLRQHLKKHMRTHTGEKPFECNVCGKRFGYKRGLVYHGRTHTGETPFMCDYCDRGFYDGSVLKRHVRKAHPEKAVKQKNDFKIEYEFDTDDTFENVD